MERCSAFTAPLPTAVSTFPCLNNATGRISLPLPWGDPPERQVPLFIRFEVYAEWLPSRSLRGLTFIQIGANCGKNTYGCAVGGDPVWSYATMCGWRGLVIEPISYIFRKLCWNYARWPSVIPLRGAVADRAHVAQISLGGGESNKLLSRPVGHVPTAATAVRASRRNETVQVLSLGGVWDEARRLLHPPDGGGPLVVDLLVIDAEGAEVSILLGAEEALAFRPSLILFEHAHLTHAAQGAIHTRLRRHGYALLASLKNKDPRGRHLPPANRLYGRKEARSRRPMARSLREA